MKLFNKIFLPVVVLAVAFACNPLEDTYNELEVAAEAEGDAGTTLEYTLTSDEYSALADELRALGTVEDSVTADFMEQNELVVSGVEVAGYLEELAAANYPQFNIGTAVKVSYNYYEGAIPDYSAYTSPNTYELVSSDYSAVEKAGFFYPSMPAEDYLPGILATSVQDALDGDIYAVSYMASSDDPEFDESTAGEQTIFTDDLNSGTADEPVDGYFAQSVTGDQEWVYREFSGDGYAYMSGYSGGAVPNEDWIVLEDVDLSEYSEATMSLYQAANFLGSGVFGTDLAIKVSTDFNGTDVSAATWTDVVPDVWPAGNNWTFVTSTIDLTAFAGQTISIGFYYRSTSDFAAAWELSDITITAPGAGPTLLSEAPIENIDYYMLDGSDWEKVDGVYSLNADDYNAMGEASGLPGRYDNFSDDAPADAYLPKFLNNFVDYPVEGNEIILVYKYFSGGVQTLASEYTYMAGEWVMNYLETTTKIDQIKKNSTGWAFDPSVVYEMVSADYQTIVDVVKGEYPDLVDDFGTGEFYYGAGSYFVNFDLRASKRTAGGDFYQAEYDGLSAEATKQLIEDRMIEGVIVFLENTFTDATTVEGIDVTYTITFATYDGSNKNWVAVFTVTGPAQFELTEGPTEVK